MPKGDELSPESARLNAILRLMLDYQREKKKDTTTTGDQILYLMDAGVPQADACKILGIDPSQAPSYFRFAQNKALLEKFGKRRGVGAAK